MGLKEDPLLDNNSAPGSEPTIPAAFKAGITDSKQSSGKGNNHGNNIGKHRELPSDVYITYGIQMHGGRLLLPMALLMMAAFWGVHAADPHIEKIERFGTNQNQVLLHFETPANRTTALQITSSLRPPAVWTNLFVFPPEPFPGHYVYLDVPSGPRFYRLRITQ
jgi:hypothetical protein